MVSMQVSDVFNAEPILSPTQDQVCMRGYTGSRMLFQLHSCLSLLMGVCLKRVDDIYRQMFDGTSPYSELAKQLLHTQYHKRDALSSTNVEW